MSDLRQLIPWPIVKRYRHYLRDPYRKYKRSRKVMQQFELDDAKYALEFEYWNDRWHAEGGCLKNAHYEKILLSMAGEEDQEFLKDKVVADFGCGPRGSLQWADAARIRIGIDVLADLYGRFDIRSHDICYVTSSEKAIPLPGNYVEVLFTMNAMDHVYHFDELCAEVLRIIAPGGLFIASFNLDEPPSYCEPQTLTEAIVERHLLQHMDVQSYRIAPKGPGDDTYRYHFSECDGADAGGARILWVRAQVNGR